MLSWCSSTTALYRFGTAPFKPLLHIYFVLLVVLLTGFFFSFFFLIPGELLHGPHQGHPVQGVRWLLPAHVHHEGAHLLHVPPQHADRAGLHPGATTPAPICGAAAPTPCKCLRAHGSEPRDLPQQLTPWWRCDWQTLFLAKADWWGHPDCLMSVLKAICFLFVLSGVFKLLIIKAIDLGEHQVVRESPTAASASRVCACTAFASKGITWKVLMPTTRDS